VKARVLKRRARRVLAAPLALGAAGGGADVIVVLGAALAADGRLGPALERRVRAGVEAFRDGRAPWLLMTGALESAAMRARAVELGAPPDAILCEPTALTTRENALRCAAILRARGFERALIVTQPYHLRRAVAAFRNAGVAAEPLPASDGGDSLLQIAREYVALTVYAARGWL